MAKRLRAHVALAGDLGSVLRTHVVAQGNSVLEFR